MRTLIIGLLALAVSAAVISLIASGDTGYALFSYRSWTVEGSLALFLLLDLLLFVTLYFVIRLAVRIWGMPVRLREWRKKQGARRARQALTRGLVELSEGNWKEAEKRLVQHATRSETPLLNYLAAAKAAQQQGAHERRDRYLQLAHESMPSADVAVGLTQAELQLAHSQMERALATLTHLRGIAPHHLYVLKLLKDLYLRLEEWPQLQRLLPELHKRKVADKQELRRLEILIYRNLLRQAQRDPDPERLGMIWNGIPKGVRSESEMIAEYAELLMSQGRGEVAEPLLRDALRHEWDERLVELYGRVEGRDPGRQLTLAEGWLQKRPQNGVLLLALARMSLRNRLWGKARSYLEASLGALPTAAAYRELGVLLERMGESGDALRCYRSGLGFFLGPVSAAALEPISRSGGSAPAKVTHPPVMADAPSPAKPPDEAQK
jgi:HemY protein